MSEMASNLSQMDLSHFAPQAEAQAPEKSCRIARTVALSRRCPIQDATDYWASPEEVGTGSGGSPPGQDVHNVDT
jgi:hypothetical protein